jgi:hypothetical protein
MKKIFLDKTTNPVRKKSIPSSSLMVREGIEWAVPVGWFNQFANHSSVLVPVAAARSQAA